MSKRLAVLAAAVLAAAAVPARVSAAATHVEEGEVLLPAPLSGLVGGITENDLAQFCVSPPLTQGVDGWVFEIPDGFAGGPARVTGAGPVYDFDAYFYTEDCAYIRDTSMATESPDEEGQIPADAAFIVADLFVGLDALVQFCAGDLNACPPIGQAGGGGGASPTPAPSPSAAPSSPPGPAPSPSAAPSAPPSQAPAPSPTEAAGPSPSPQPGGRASTVLEATSARVTHGETFELRGKVFLDPGCGERDDYGIVLERRRSGSDRFVALARDVYVNPDGRWSTALRAGVNATYRATPSGRCEGEVATPVDVLVRARVVLDDLPARCRAGLAVTGRVAPDLSGTEVVLQRRGEQGWRTVSRAQLDAGSRFTLELAACGAPQRVMWPSQGPTNVAGRARLVFD